MRLGMKTFGIFMFRIGEYLILNKLVRKYIRHLLRHNHQWSEDLGLYSTRRRERLSRMWASESQAFLPLSPLYLSYLYAQTSFYTKTVHTPTSRKTVPTNSPSLVSASIFKTSTVPWHESNFITSSILLQSQCLFLPKSSTHSPNISDQSLPNLAAGCSLFEVSACLFFRWRLRLSILIFPSFLQTKSNHCLYTNMYTYII